MGDQVDDALRRELIALARPAPEVAVSGALFDPVPDEALVEALREGVARLEAIIRAHHWPGRSLVGEDGARAAWRLILHAAFDPWLMRQCDPHLMRAAQTQEIPPAWYVHLLDRIRILEGKPQIYASQFTWGPDGTPTPWPVARPDTLSLRREAVGLPPLDEVAIDAPAPPGDPTAWQEAVGQWLEAVGWR